MSQHQTDQDRFVIARFFATMYADEISREMYEALTGKEFSKSLKEAGEKVRNRNLAKGLKGFYEFLNQADNETHFNMRAEYADIFLNAGPNPVAPYESVWADREPMTHQEPLFESREMLRKAGLHKDPAYPQPEDHIAVQFDLLAELNRRAAAGDKEAGQARYDFGRSRVAWRTEFCAALASADNSGFYKALADLNLAWLYVAHLAMFPAEEVAPQLPAQDMKIVAQTLDLLPLKTESFLLKPGAVDPEPLRSFPSHCYSCGALCGMTAKVKDGVLLSTTGLQGDPKGAGRLCPKGAANPAHVYSAYRLKEPLIREKGRFVKATWDEALDKVVEGMKSMEWSELGYFRGNDWCNWVHEALFDHLGCPKTTHRPMCDNANRMSNEHNLNDKRPWINYQESDYIIHFGMNELATSYGQRKTAELKAALQRGAKLVVFDPRRCETAAAAREWVQIKPSTDAAVALAMCQVIIKNDLYDHDFVSEWTHGFEEFKKRLMGEEDGVVRDPAWAAKLSGVPKETIERIALEFAKAKRKGAISWTGLAQVPNGMYATAAVQALNGLCGTFDAPGGPSLPFKRKLSPAWGEGQEKPPKGKAPKLNNFGMWSGWAPAFLLQNVEAGKLKGMICYYGDPVLSWGNQEATTKAIEKMQFKACIDAFMCNTACLCDVVLPDATWLEQSQIKPDWLYDAFVGYFAEVVKPQYNSKPMYEITLELAKRLGLGKHFPWKNIEEAFLNQLKGMPLTLEQLKENGFVVTDKAEYFKYLKWGSLNPPKGYGSSGETKTGKYNFLNPVAQEKGVDPLPDYHPAPTDLAPDAVYPFIYVNFRAFQHEHCSTFNNYRLMKAYPKNPLWVNHMGAHDLGIAEGDKVIVKSPWGTTEMEVFPTWDIMSGMVGAAGGFGHKRGLEGDPKFPDYKGVNGPAISKPNTADDMGGTTLLKYIKVRLEKAA